MAAPTIVWSAGSYARTEQLEVSSSLLDQVLPKGFKADPTRPPRQDLTCPKCHTTGLVVGALALTQDRMVAVNGCKACTFRWWQK